jgi:chromosome segregation ATPase
MTAPTGSDTLSDADLKWLRDYQTRESYGDTSRTVRVAARMAVRVIDEHASLRTAREQAERDLYVAREMIGCSETEETARLAAENERLRGALEQAEQERDEARRSRDEFRKESDARASNVYDLLGWSQADGVEWLDGFDGLASLLRKGRDDAAALDKTHANLVRVADRMRAAESALRLAQEREARLVAALRDIEAAHFGIHNNDDDTSRRARAFVLLADAVDRASKYVAPTVTSEESER